MNCAESERLFDAYLDGELTGSLRLEFDAHRLRCRRCQQTIAMLESVAHVIESDSRMPVLSQDFTDRVMGTIARRQPAAKRYRATRVAVVAGFALQAAAVLALVILLPADSPPAPVAPSPGLLASAEDSPLDADSLDSAELRNYILDRVDMLKSAGNNFSNDFAILARYPVNINVADEYARSSQRVLDASPWRSLLEAIAPPPAKVEEAEPAPLSGDVYSL